MSSAAGRFGYPNRSPYSTSKWGLIGFTKTLSIELGEHGIRVNAILPGAVDGPRIQKVFEGRAQVSGQTVEQVRQEAMANQSIKALSIPATSPLWPCFWPRTVARRSRVSSCPSTTTC